MQRILVGQASVSTSMFCDCMQFGIKDVNVFYDTTLSFLILYIKKVRTSQKGILVSGDRKICVIKSNLINNVKNLFGGSFFYAIHQRKQLVRKFSNAEQVLYSQKS